MRLRLTCGACNRSWVVECSFADTDAALREHREAHHPEMAASEPAATREWESGDKC